jgi:hypothetical protein
MTEFINKCFDEEIIPFCLDYRIDNNCFKVDFKKLEYNTYYNSFEFFEKKFPKGWDCIIGFDEVIQNIANMSLLNEITPLKELDKINNLNNINSNK